MNDSGHSCYRARLCGFGGAISGQKTATGPTETTRANALKPLAVHRPPTIAPRPHKGKQLTRRSTLTASRPLNRARQAERQREQQHRTQKPSDQEWAQVTSRPPKPKIGRPGRNPNWSGTRKPHPPHHLAKRAEMRRERQPRTEKKHPEDSPTPSPRRVCRDEEGEPTGTEKKVAGVRRNEQILDPQSTNEPRRQERARMHRTRDHRLLHPSRWTKSSERRGKPSGSNTRASRDRPNASHPSEGRERDEGKTREAKLPKKSTKGHRSSGSKVSEQS